MIVQSKISLEVGTPMTAGAAPSTLLVLEQIVPAFESVSKLVLLLVAPALVFAPAIVSAPPMTTMITLMETSSSAIAFPSVVVDLKKNSLWS